MSNGRRRQTSEALAQAQVVLARIRSGETLADASDGLAPLRLPPHLVAAWREIHVEIESGRTGFVDGVESFSSLLRVEARVRRRIENKAWLPRAQAAVVVALSLLVAGAAFVLFPPGMKPAAPELAVALGLIISGTVVFRALERRFDQRLWLADWSLFLGLLARQLRAGQPLGVALATWSSSQITARFPPKLAAEVARLSQALARGETPTLEPVTGIDALTQARDRLRHLARLVARGSPVAEVLTRFADESLADFEESLEEAAQRLALELLLPLFGCFAPAQLVLLFAPLLRALTASQ